jgi:hypothetical protein
MNIRTLSKYEIHIFFRLTGLHNQQHMDYILHKEFISNFFSSQVINGRLFTGSHDETIRIWEIDDIDVDDARIGMGGKRGKGRRGAAVAANKARGAQMARQQQQQQRQQQRQQQPQQLHRQPQQQQNVKKKIVVEDDENMNSAF